MKTRSIDELKVRLLELLKQEAFKTGKFILSSGKESNYYLDGRIITMTPEGAYLIAKIMHKLYRVLN